MKLPQLSGRDVIKILYRNGFVVVRQKGSHIRLEKNTSEGTIKLTVPNHPVLKKGTLHQIIRASELKEEDFAS
ncbi:type II toxin-antitoxin system HicA family toxin [Candidatus Woesearchaeota archaeon]|nr:type II toxin-antitoxin system HicA family toxin [Candidatus Woesearchaeota archaeon]